jgi:hypothetical protein
MVKIAGGLIIAAGALLLIGNKTELFPTVPFAGWLTILVGGALSAMGDTVGGSGDSAE